MTETARKIGNSFVRVFRRPRYIALAASIAIITYVFFVGLKNLSFLVQVAKLSIPLQAKASVIGHVFAGVSSSLGTTAALHSIAAAVLFGVNAALLTFLLVRGGSMLGRAFGAGALGMLSGIVGIGCAACGSLLLVTLFSATGIAAAFAVLPLKGGEFGILSVLLLGATAGILLKRIGDPLVCPPEAS